MAIYFKKYNGFIDEEKEEIDKNYVTLVIYLLKALNMINGLKYIKKKVNHSLKKLFLKE